MRLTDPVAEVAFAAFHRRLDAASPAPLALALSGGGDSLALLHLACAWARKGGRPVLALTLDHRLNPDSADWTRFAADAARAAGAQWRGLSWDGPKPSTGLPAAARAVRHALIAEAAREAGAGVVLFGHTADDVAEAALMRATDVPDLGTLREWSPSPAWPEGRGVFLLRPLLGISRGALRGWLQARKLDWLEDPANEDQRFARARARTALSTAHPGESRDPGVFFGERAGFRKNLGPGFRRDERDWGGEAVVGPDGSISIPRQAIVHADPEAARRFLAAALLCASGGVRPPRTVALDRLLARLAAEETVTATLAGSRVVAEGETVRFGREAGRKGLESRALDPGRMQVWDGRFEVQADAPGLTLRSLAGFAARLSKTDRAALTAIAAAFRPALPVLSDDAGSVALPGPLGSGAGRIRALAGGRLAAACGLIAQESALSPAKLEAGHGAEAAVILS